jgi:hypothetical protein
MIGNDRQNMYRQIERVCNAMPEKLALDTDAGERFTYRDIERESRRPGRGPGR